MSDRTFSGDEVSRIIKRAAELEAERSLKSGDGTRAGLTISELEHIAADSGIDPDLIRIAADEAAGNHSGKTDPQAHNSVKTRMRGDEIATEYLIPGYLSDELTEALITELNHRFGTSEDDISWWDDLWKSYAGKATIRKTKNSTEWRYTTENETYSVRALFQQRGENIRIRISKKTLWGISWDQYMHANWLLVPICLIVGGGIGHGLLDSPAIGIGIGILAFMLSYPFAKKASAKFVEKHRDEVEMLGTDLENLAVQLAEQTPQKSSYRASGSAHKKQHSTTIDVEDLDGDTGSASQPEGRLRNQLR
ncbi:MAG: hypothetical protein LAT84_05270 [Balneolia bacterium]|nr:hypothetical protein [Balneolia bacterium]